MGNEQPKQPSINFISLLVLVFITLKLTGTINWSWWWVLSPIWVPVAFIVLLAIIYAFIEKGNKKW
jgi:predicted tellurium resistance membrane protein TerC